MVERIAVERLLQGCEQGAAIRVPAGPMLAELCRTWLRVQDAPVVKVRGKVGEVCIVPVSHDFCGQRVRLVRNGGE